MYLCKQNQSYYLPRSREESFYLTEMHKCLRKAYRDAYARKDIHTSTEAIYAAVMSPAPRYWISPTEAARQISRLEAGLPVKYKSENKKEIITHVYENYKRLKRKFRGLSVRGLAQLAVNQPAPRFFIAPSRARKILNIIGR